MTEPLDRIEAALARLGAEHEPPRGWEARVLAAVATRRRRPWWLYAAPGLTLAAAAVFLVWFIAAPRPAPAAIALDVRFDHKEVVRGDERVVGDIAHVRVSGGNRHRVVRVYRDEVHVVKSCPDDPACRVSSDATAVDFPLAQVGTYTIVALSSDAPLPALPGNLDGDTAAAMQAGVSDIRQHRLSVR